MSLNQHVGNKALSGQRRRNATYIRHKKCNLNRFLSFSRYSEQTPAEPPTWKESTSSVGLINLYLSSKLTSHTQNFTCHALIGHGAPTQPLHDELTIASLPRCQPYFIQEHFLTNRVPPTGTQRTRLAATRHCARDVTLPVSMAPVSGTGSARKQRHFRQCWKASRSMGLWFAVSCVGSLRRVSDQRILRGNIMIPVYLQTLIGAVQCCRW